MKYELKKLNMEMGIPEYDMFQEIPKKELGAQNEANGLSFIEFKEFLKLKINEEKVELSEKEAPRITYIMYLNSYPIGKISIRPRLNDYWELHSGHIGFTIRPSERNKHYGSKILELALKECKRMKLFHVKLVCSPQNIGSQKVIQNNGGEIIKQDESTFFYKIDL